MVLQGFCYVSLGLGPILVAKAEKYNGALVLTLAGLLCPSQEQRSRASEVLSSLQRLQDVSVPNGAL